MGLRGYISLALCLSPFLAARPVFAQLPPPSISFDFPYYSDPVVFIGPESQVRLSAPAGAEGATVYYVLDAPPEPANETLYAGPLTLAEGLHALYARLTLDGYWSGSSSAAVHVDALPPATTLLIGGVPAGAPGGDGFLHLPASAAVGFSAEDDASGYNSTEFYVDTDPESCDYEGPLVSTMPAGSCQNDLYTVPFTLAPGTHTLYYHSYDNVDNGGEMEQIALSVDTGGWIRGSVATPDLPPGSTVTLLVSGDMFRDDPQLFPFAAQGTSLAYVLQLPAPATYYIGAAAWYTEEEEYDIPSGTPIGIYNDYAPVHLSAPAVEAAGVDITASPDTEAPEVSITSPVYNGGLDSIDRIAGFLSDDTGAPELEFALRDVSSGLWYMNGGWQTSEEPLFSTPDILFDGPPSSCSWRAADSGEGMLGGIAGTLVQGAVYELFVLAEDFTTNEPDPTPSVRFTWTAGQGPSAPGAVEGLAASEIGLSSIAWTWQAAATADGYAVYSPEGVFLSSETGTAWTLTGLAAAAPAGLCVSAYNAAGEGPRACSAARYTLPAVPGAPSAVQVSSYSLMFRWYTGVNNPGADCELQLSTDDFAGAEPLSFRLTAWGEETDLAVDGLAAGATYYARTRAFNGENVPSAYSASTTAVTAPAPLTPPDNTPPYTELAFSGPSYQAGDAVYISTGTAVVLSSTDTAAPGETASGVSAVLYLLDPADPEDEPSLYGTPLLLAEGAHTLYYSAVDAADNEEERKSAVIKADGTAPDAALFLEAVAVPPGQGTLSMPAGALLSLSASDPETNGVASGLKRVLYIVDMPVPPEECLAAAYDPGAPAGACANPVYTAPFTLGAGTHTLHYGSLDLVDNAGPLRSLAVDAGYAPAAPPQVAGAALGVSSIAFTWAAVEGASGYRVYSGDGLAQLADGPAAEYVLTGLQTNTRNNICVGAYNSYGETPPACETYVYTLAAAPGAPVFNLISSHSFQVEWQHGDNPYWVTGYEVSLSTDAFVLDFSTPAPVSAGLRDDHLPVGGLAAATTYWARLRAYNGDNALGGFSGTSYALTLAAPPEPPENLSAVFSTAARSVALTWTAAAAGTPAVKFNLYRAQDPAPEEFNVLASGLTEPSYTDLPSQTATYYYRVAGVSADGLEGEPSPPAGLFTDPLPPGHVSDLAAGQADPSDGSIVLSWTAPAEDHALGRYIIKDVTEGGWDGGTVLADVAASTGPGGRETFTLFFPSTETVRTLALRAVDAFGNESLYTSNNAFADFVPPRILSVSGAPEPGSMAGRPFTILVQAGDNHLVARRDILVDGELLESGYAGEGFYYSWPLTSFPDGWHTLSVVVLDAAGNSARWDLPLVVNYVPPPAPRIAWPTGETFQLNETSIDIYGESDPDIYASLFLDGVYYGSQPTSNGLFAFHGVPLPGDGSFVVTLQAADQKGSSPGSAPLTLIVDSGPPAPPAELSAEAGVYGGVKISWKPPSGETPASYYVYRSTQEGGLAEGGTAPLYGVSPQVTGLEHTDYPRPDGVYYYSAASVDAAGNYSVLSNVAAAVTDSSAPSAEISLPGVQPPLGAGTYRVELEVSEVLSVSPYLVFTPPLAGPIVLPLEPETPYLWAGTFTVTAAMRSGTGYFSYEGVDLAGNKGGEMTSGGTLELDTAGPEASLVFEPEAGPALKADAYPLLLTLSRPSAAAPELHYSVAGGTSAVALSSSSSASEWSGLLGVDSGTGEGAHYFLFSARDTLGNTGTLLTGATYFIADTLAPGAPLSPNWANGPGGRVDLSWSAPAGERPSAYRLYRDGEPLSAAVAPDPEYHSGSYSEVPPPGARVYRIAAVDAAGNEGPLSDPVETLSDGEPPPPPAELSVSADGALVQLAWTAGQGEPAVSFRLYRSTSPISSAAGLSGRALIGAAASDAPGRDGVYYYALSAVDAAGNESAPAAAEPLAYDGAAPEITITGAEDGVHYNAPVRPQVGIYDLAPDQAGILLDGSVFVPGALVASEGSHTLLVNASDASGNSSSATVVFVVDLTTPVITVGGVSQGGSYVSAVTPAVSASDAYLSSVTALLNGAAYPIGESITAGGAYTLEVTARDFAGNSSAYSVSFELDPPPPGPAGLSAVIEDGSALALAWEPIPGAALYKVYRDGVYLSPASSASFRDTGYAAGTAAVYEVAGIDGKGREGGRARAELPALRFSLAGYGNYAGSAQALNRGFFDTVRFTVENGGGLPLAAGPLTLSSAGGAAAPAPAATVPAGGSAELSAVVYTAASSSAAAAARAELALPPAGDAALKAVLNFSMSSREPVQPVVELYPEALVRGAYAKAKLKFNNRGSAPADVVTAVVSNYAARPSTAAALALRTPAGFTLSRAELLQASRDVNAAFLDGAQVYYVRVPPGSSYLFDPVELAVPLSAEGELLLAGGVYSMHYALDRTPLSAEPAFEAVLPQSAAAVIPYTAFASPSKEVYDKGEPVVISGYALDPATGLRPGGKAVLLTVSNRGFERAVGVTTAQDGSFVHVSTPTAGEAGIYYVTASYPYAVSRLAQSSYSITGFEPGYTDYTARLAQNSSYTFDVPLHNTGETVLTGLEASFTQDSGTGVAVSAADPPSEIQPGERKNLSVTLSAAPDASPAASFTLKVRESHGFERVMPIEVSVSPAQVVPRLTPQSFETGMLAGEVRSRAITVENIGYSTWTGITAGAPSLSWVRLQGPPQLGDLAPGGNVTFTLLLEPPPGLSNGVYPLDLQLSGGGHPAVPVSAAITVTSDRQGGLLFTALNADKTPGDPGRWIGGADFTLTSVDIKGLSLRARTDPNGLARFENVPAGRYGWRAEAEGFQTVTGQADVEPGLTPALTALLPTAMVSYKWSVTPTTITDKYDITLDMTFRTDVPAPALVVDPPAINLLMAGGQTMNTQYTIKNKGLVSAYNVQVFTYGGDPAIEAEAAFSEIAEIKAGESVVVPLRVKLAHASCHTCGAGQNYTYRCAAGLMTPAAADSVSITAGGPECGGGGGGAGVFGGFGGSGGGGGGSSGYAPKSVTKAATTRQCSSGSTGGFTGFLHRVLCAVGMCIRSEASLRHAYGSLAIDWGLYYDPGLNKFFESTDWTIEERSDGTLLLTDHEGNQIVFAPKGKLNIELTDPCGQYDDVPGANAEVSYQAGGYTVARKSGEVLAFGKHGGKYKPDAIRDQNNTTLTYAYDDNGNVTRITDVHGRYLTFSYDGQGRKSEVTDHAGRRVLLAYDGQGRLSGVTDADGGVSSYVYGADGRLASVTRPNGSHEYTVYDSTGRLLDYEEDYDNNKRTFFYNDIDSTTLLTDALGRETLYKYWHHAGRAEITGITGPDGAVTEYEYDGNYNRTLVKDARGNSTQMEYSYYNGNLLSVTDAAGSVTTLRYGLGSAANKIAAAVSHVYGASRGEAAASGCDLGVTMVDSVGIVIPPQPYTPEKEHPFLTTVTDPRGNTTKMDYDLNGNLIEVKDALNNVTKMNYDQHGHVTQTKDPLGNISIFEYDNYGALNRVTDPLGRVTQMTRDNLSQVTQTRDPSNKLTLFEYDIKGNLTKVTDALNGITEYGYTGGCAGCGGGDLLASVKDAKNQTTSFAYDLQKRLTGTTNPLSQSKTFEYDKKGNLTKVIDAKGQQITFEYDVNDRLTVRHLPEGDVSYTYDPVGNLLSVTSPDSQVSMTYGILNQVTQVQQVMGGQIYTISYGYDVNGNRTSMTSPWGTTSYTYDALNRLISLTNPDGKLITFAYDALGRRTRLTYPNGIETTYAYDAASQLTQILHRKIADSTALAFNNYGYDAAGNRTSNQDIAGTHSYGYDDLHRLISASHPSLPNETFAYDAVGNRTSDAVMTDYQHNAANRLLENSSYTYTYDNNGNLTGQTHKVTSEHTAYAYTSENQLKQVTLPDGLVVTFKYDPFGRRIEKASPGGTTRFIYDKEDVLAILDGGNNLIASFTHNRGIDKPLIMKANDNNSYFYHADGLGSITGISDASGSIVERVEYTAYGVPTIFDGNDVAHSQSTINNLFFYTAREYDSDTNLYFYRQRYYAPKIGRFLQEDYFPGLRNRPQTINRYVYVTGNPIKFIDPFGLWSLDTGGDDNSPDTTYRTPPTLPLPLSDEGADILGGLEVFLECMGSKIGLPGMVTSERGMVVAGLVAAGTHDQLRAWKYAGSKCLVFPRKSSIFRNLLYSGVVLSKAAGILSVAFFATDVFDCLLEEWDHVNRQKQ